MEKVRWTRSDVARKLGRYFSSRAAATILFRVCSGMERAAVELFRTAETVPGVRPRCCATAFRVTTPFCFLGPGLKVVIRKWSFLLIRRNLQAHATIPIGCLRNCSQEG